MKVQQSTDVQFANVQDRDNISKNDVGASKGSDKGTIKSVSGTGIMGESIIVQRRNLARKQAFRVVADAFDNEMKIDERLRAINETIRKISDEICENNYEIEKGHETLKKLQEELHVDPDSEEHRKLMEYGRG
jgi:peptidoglycan hydrolase CwlO-like protein